MENTFDLDAPVIATGKGGSGTRILASLLKQFDIFMGNRLNHSEDSIEWKELTREMLFSNIAIKNESFNAAWSERLRLNAIKVLGQAECNAYRQWGCKLPEIMHFIPEFMTTFPEARLIHLVRHPVSLSLRRTHVSSRLDNIVGQAILPRAYRFLELDSSQMHLQAGYINNAISWEYQIRSLIDDPFVQSLPGERYLLLRYEDLVRNPQNAAKQINQFLGIESPVEVVELEIDHNRINQIDVDDERIAEVWSICGPTAERIGYAYPASGRTENA